jgi:hypothetical protein
VLALLTREWGCSEVVSQGSRGQSPHHQLLTNHLSSYCIQSYTYHNTYQSVQELLQQPVLGGNGEGPVLKEGEEVVLRELYHHHQSPASN